MDKLKYDNTLILSRRNLEALLAALNRGERPTSLHRDLEDGTVLAVIAEEDGPHYSRRKKAQT